MTTQQVAPPPPVVVDFTDALGEKLNRPTHCRRVKKVDEESWYIYDPVFSFIQRGIRKGATGYRVGYRIDLIHNQIYFTLVHSPHMAKLFKHNLVLATLIQVVQATSSFRSGHWLYRSSKVAYNSGSNGAVIQSSSLEAFVAQLHAFDQEHGFVKDLFPKRLNTGKGGAEGKTAPVAGNTFYLLLASGAAVLDSRQRLRELVNLSWPLFLCLYPVKPIETRSANLARNMTAAGITRRCEFNLIEIPAGTNIRPLCWGKTQGAHIKPDAQGGSDRAENGVWLCEYHHRATEGKLVGRRTREPLRKGEVRYIGARAEDASS